MKIAQLTGLRFVAALSVYFSHLDWDSNSSLIGRIFEQGYVGVSFLFVLSGFVLSYSYKKKLRDGYISFRSYALLRIARLAPMHIATALPFFFLLYDDSLRAALVGIFNILLLQSWFPHSGVYFSLNAPSWSLSNEVFFYIAFVPLIYLSQKRLCYLFLVLAAVIVSAAIIFFSYLSGYVLIGSRSVSHWLFYIFPVSRLLEFIAGMLIFEAWHRGYRPCRGFFVISIFSLGTAMFFGKSVAEEFRYSLFFLPFVSFILFASLGADAFGLRWLASSWAVFLGNAFFAFYLLHQPMLGVLKKIPTFAYLGDVDFLAASLLIIIAASSCSYLFFEIPTERHLRRTILSRDPLK